MKIDKLGVPRFTEADLVSMIYKGHTDKCMQVLCENSTEVEKFNKAADRFGNPHLDTYQPLDVTMSEFDSTLQATWFMPDDYKKINVEAYLIERCSSQDEMNRVSLEMREYCARGMEDVLRYMIYLVDFMREHKILWGVGRGSSVSSYVLFLIGVHKIDSLKYNLDWREFLR